MSTGPSYGIRTRYGLTTATTLRQATRLYRLEVGDGWPSSIHRLHDDADVTPGAACR